MVLMRLKLKKRQREELIQKFGHIPTRKEIFEKIKKSQERLIYSLAGAWETAPDNPHERKQLLKAIEKAIKMREEIYKMIGEKPPEISRL